MSQLHFPIDPSLLRVAEPLLPRPAVGSQIALPGPSIHSEVQPYNSSQYSTQSGSKRWTNEDIELLIDWFGADLRNLELYKTKAKDALIKISKDVFDGKRSASAIKGKWDGLKEKHREARARLESTGEGEFDLLALQSDKQKWEGIKVGWLSKICPYFEELEDVLRRDISYTPYYVSETGGTNHIQVFNGSTSQRLESSQIPDTYEYPLSEIDEYEDEHNVHPQAGGQKNPLKRGEPSGEGRQAIKKRKKLSGEELIREQQSARLAFDNQRFLYEKERDKADREFLIKKEENRHEEAMRRFDYMIKKMEMDELRWKRNEQ